MSINNFDIFNVIFFSLTGFYLPFIPLFFHHRHIHPISARSPIIVLAMDFALYFFGIDYLLQLYGTSWPCIIRNFFNLFAPLIAGTIGCYRLMQLLFSYRIAANAAEYQISGGKDWKESWYAKNRWLVHATTFKRGVIIIYSLYFFIYILVQILDGPKCFQPCLDASIKPSVAQNLLENFKLANVGVFVMVGVPLAWKLRTLQGDIYGLKTEMVILFYTSIAAMLWAIFAMIMKFPSSSLQSSKILALHSTFISSTIIPYFQSRKEIHREISTLSRRQTYALKLVDILRDTDGFIIFLKYLEKEFSSENALFWQAVEKFKLIDPQTDFSLFKQTTFDIYHSYIQENGRFQTNLSEEVRNDVENTLTQLNSASQPEALQAIDLEELTHIFDLAQQNIFDLMNNDSFPRFRKLEEYQKYYTTNSIITRGGGGGDGDGGKGERQSRSEETHAETGVEAHLITDKNGLESPSLARTEKGNGIEMDFRFLNSISVESFHREGENFSGNLNHNNNNNNPNQPEPASPRSRSMEESKEHFGFLQNPATENNHPVNSNQNEQASPRSRSVEGKEHFGLLQNTGTDTDTIAEQQV